MKEPKLLITEKQQLQKKGNILVVLLLVVILIAFVATASFVDNKVRATDLSKTQMWLYGVGNYGNAPNEFVMDEDYYSPNIITEYINQTSDMKLLAYKIYRYACLTYGSVSEKSWHLYAEGQVKALDATANLVASGVRFEKRRGNTFLADSVLNNISMISQTDGGVLGLAAIDVAKDLVQYGEKRIYSKDYDYLTTADANSFYLDDTFDIASANFNGSINKYDNSTHVPAKKSKGYVYREYPNDWYDEYGLSSPEKTDFIINTESIIGNSVKIIEKQDNFGVKYYELSFDVDCDKILSNGTTATYYFEQFMINHLDLYDSAFKNFDLNIKYDSLNITMEIWDSGYFRSWKTDEVWEIQASIFGITVPAVSNITSYEYYSYDPEDNIFDQLYDSMVNSNKVVEFKD